MNDQPTINYDIKVDQAKMEPKSIITFAITRCTDDTANHKANAFSIVPGAPSHIFCSQKWRNMLPSTPTHDTAPRHPH